MGLSLMKSGIHSSFEPKIRMGGASATTMLDRGTRALLNMDRLRPAVTTRLID